MRSIVPLLVLAAVATSSLPAGAAGKVDLQWVEPEKFSDIGFSSHDRADALRALAEHFERLARRLPDGQTLRIDVTDVNLAGELRFGPRGEVRVMKHRADWPTMELRYTLESGGRAIKSGQTRLSDMTYGSSLRQDSFGYERRMIERWFESEFESRH